MRWPRFLERAEKRRATMDPEVEHVACHVLKMHNGVVLHIETEEQSVTIMLPRLQAVEMVDAILDVLNFEAEAS